MIEITNDLKVSRYMYNISYPYRMKDAKWWINKCIKGIKEKPRKDYNFHIELKPNKKVIGSIGLFVKKYHGTANLGYLLERKYHRQGIMSEALGKILEFAFKRLKLRRINADVCKENKPSYILLKKFGFKREGLRRKFKKMNSTGKIHDVYVYGLLKEDYKKI